MENLQLILGLDKKNPLFSVYSSETTPELLEVYFGFALLERVEKGKDSLQFKLLAGRLYNMNYKRKALVEAFEVDLKTIQKWGNALKSGDLALIESVLAGHDARRKLTPEIESYARSRFREVYQNNHYDYSNYVRQEIQEHFKTTLSAETLRPIFRAEKQLVSSTARSAENNKNNDSICDSEEYSSSENEANRKQTPSLPSADNGNFVHHAGILLLLHLVINITRNLTLQHLSCQWLISALLGAVNIEQSRGLDFASLIRLIKMEFLISPRHQRNALKIGSTEKNRILLFRKNAHFVSADESRWFYYDPHGIRYNGIRKILKGWCGSVGKIAKVHYQDFIHTSSGAPVFFKNFDNYYDLRERFSHTVAEFTQVLENPPTQLIFVIDRGIYGQETLSRINRNGIVLITWEKGYEHDGWDAQKTVVHFRLTRYRNSFHYTISCQFNCIRYPFEKIPEYDRIIVRASGEKKEDIEVSVLVNSNEISTEDAVTAIFTRWVQENDFLYEIRHFGLNQITSYNYEDYGSLNENLIEKAVDSNEYIVLKLKRDVLNKKLKTLLLKKEKTMDKGKKLKAEDKLLIKDLKQELVEISKAMKSTEKQCAKEAKLIAQGAQRLKTEPKQYMDIIRITARNIFFKLFKEFRPVYNNFRNDHVLLRELTRAPGFISVDAKKITVTLYPALTLQPKEKERLQLFLNIMADNIASFSNQSYEFKLHNNNPKATKGGISICDCHNLPTSSKY